ncbi:hypothetical protein [Propioniciclava tarda]|uniref:hypothetical protein n=1 Tax=Propioniciclava tarda TaxID=433330 RepID=UPI00116FE049|nr:hypothetical protein [Propioniciclava tarda]SMO31875.1 hypothetical protein SAMN06266982_10119 [Propioniciclava tarda]
MSLWSTPCAWRYASEWDLCYLGVPLDRGVRTPLPDADHLVRLTGATTTHALAVHARAFDAILDAVPADPTDAAAWIADHLAIDQWLANETAAGRLTALLVTPDVAVQEAHLHYPSAVAEPERFRDGTP